MEGKDHVTTANRSPNSPPRPKWPDAISSGDVRQNKSRLLQLMPPHKWHSLVRGLIVAGQWMTSRVALYSAVARLQAGLGNERCVPLGSGTGLAGAFCQDPWRHFTCGLKIRVPSKRIA